MSLVHTQSTHSLSLSHTHFLRRKHERSIDRHSEFSESGHASCLTQSRSYVGGRLKSKSVRLLTHFYVPILQLEAGGTGIHRNHHPIPKCRGRGLITLPVVESRPQTKTVRNRRNLLCPSPPSMVVNFTSGLEQQQQQCVRISPTESGRRTNVYLKSYLYLTRRRGEERYQLFGGVAAGDERKCMPQIPAKIGRHFRIATFSPQLPF